MKFPDVIAEIWKLHYRLSSVESDLNFIFEEMRKVVKDFQEPIPIPPNHSAVPAREVITHGKAHAEARSRQAAAPKDDLGDNVREHKPRRSRQPE